MPRRSSGPARSSSPRRQAPAAAAPRQAPQPRPTAPAPAQAQPQGGMMSGLAGTVMQGMAFGAGSEVAHQAVRGLMGSGSSHTEATAPAQAAPQQTQQDPCFYQNQDFMACLQRSANEISACQSYLDSYKSCREQN